RRVGGNGIARVNVESLFRARRREAGARYLKAWRHHKQNALDIIKRRCMEARLIGSVWKLIGKTHAVVAGTKWPVDSFDAVAFVDGALNHRHARSAPGRDLIELAALRNLKLECAVFQVIRDRGMRLILDRVFFADEQVGTFRLYDNRARGDREGMRVGRWLIDRHVCRGGAGSDWLVIEDAFIGHAKQHGSRAQGVIRNGEMS